MIGGSLSKLGLVLVVAGALVLAGPVFGFSTFAADRGVSVSTAEDPNAILGIDMADSVELDDSDVLVATLTNNIGSEIDTLDVDIQSGILTVSSGFSDQLSEGESTQLYVECGDASGPGSQDISITIEEATSSDSGLTISRNTVTTKVEYDCGGRDTDGDFIITDVRMNDNSVEFDIENIGTSVDLGGVSIDETTTPATEVNNGNNPEILVGESGINSHPDSIIINGEMHDFHGGDRPEIGNEEEVTIIIESFMSGEGSGVNMEGETLWVTLYEQQGGGNPVQQLAISDEE
ncbi:hypothetical protein [Halovivax gelatinilyticus]|uniref:hypothetical protein n=1 Tax=Halovivax gelatinilyticus TaxID=2961597 RepID=UPI0020CA7A67|nr:hypothetical protein [Halovivax gelatinilyticus]